MKEAFGITNWDLLSSVTSTHPEGLMLDWKKCSRQCSNCVDEVREHFHIMDQTKRLNHEPLGN
jgi:hypothetical protein